MGFSLKAAADAARTPHHAAGMPAAESSGLDAGLFAALFAGQLGEAGSVLAANDRAATLAQDAVSPGSSLPSQATPLTAAKTQDADTGAADAASRQSVEAALLAQMQAVMPPPPPQAPPLPSSADAAVGREDGAGTVTVSAAVAVAAMPAMAVAAGGPDATHHTAVARHGEAATRPVLQPAEPVHGDGLPASQMPAGALPAVANPQTAAAAAPLATGQVAQVVQSVMPRQPSLASSAERPSLARQAVTGAAVATPTASPSALSLSQDAFRVPLPATAADAERAVAPAPTVSAGRARAEVLPADVRLLFRRELTPASDAAASQDLAAGSQRQMLPPLMTAPAPLAVPAAGDWRIEPPMADTPQWREAFGQKVGGMVSMGVGEASIQVSPEQLGPLDISIRFDPQERAMISVVAANPEAKSIVEGSLPQLVKMLEQSGIQLGSTQVSTQQHAGQQAQQQGQQQAHEQARQQSGQQHAGAGRQPHGLATAEDGRAERDMPAISSRQQGLSIQA